MMKLRSYLINLLLATLSILGALLLSEIVSRRILNAADYLNVEMVPDEVLGVVPSPHTIAGGFDSWGFRNRRVPERVDIVTIGDSHTYGNTATMDDAWPSVLGHLSGRSVYNLALGGYGPDQYLELLKTRALTLKPRLIVCGLYMGDDFENAFVISYGLEHWAYLRRLPSNQVHVDRREIWDPTATVNWNKKARTWLSRHSVIYQLVVHGPLLERFQGEVQVENASRLYDAATTLRVPEKHILEAFRPRVNAQNLDQDRANVLEGMRITFELLAEMNEICKQNNIQFLIAVIPTKEMVFSEYLEHNNKLENHDIVDKLIESERIADHKVFEYLDRSNIYYVNTLPALQRSVGNELYARTAADMHPSRNGYRVIAEAVYDALSHRDAGDHAGKAH